MKSKISKKYFPFSPGIPWKVSNGKYIVPEIDQDTWQSALANRDLVVLAHGGLLESFASLTVVEALCRLEPSKKLFWAGQKAFAEVTAAHGRAHYIDQGDIASKYPVPLFLDAGNKAYFNVLNNYRTEKSYYLSHERPNHKPVFEQIYRNSMLPWDRKFIPILNLNDTELNTWAKATKFHPNKKSVLIIPGATGLSQHGMDCLGWDTRELREFASMLRRFDIDIVLCTGERTPFFDTPYHQAPRTLSLMLSLMSKASVILASDIDFLLLSLVISKAAIIAPISLAKNEFDLYRNAEFVESENVIFTTDKVTPAEVYTICEEIL